MLKLFWNSLGKREIPWLSVLSAEHMPASIGDSVTADICFQSATITVLIITSKMGWLTFPISGYQRYGFPRTTRITPSRNSWISLIPHHYRNPFTLRIPGGSVSNLYPAPTSRTNGRLQTVLALWKYQWHQQDHGVIGAQSVDATNVVLFWTLSTNCKKVGGRSMVSKGQCWKFIWGITKTWYQWSLMPSNFWSKVIGSTGHMFRMTSIAHHYSTPSLCTCSANGHDHKLFYWGRNWGTIATNHHRQWQNDHITNHFNIVIGTTIQETTRNSSYLAHKQLCSTHVTNNSESGIFGFRKGVMLRSLTISSYHLWTTFSFQCSTLGYALSPPLLRPSIIFLCHSALHHPCILVIVTHSICDSFLLLL